MFYDSWIQPKGLRLSQCYNDSHWEDFKDRRLKHNENICSETNKLVLRLDKLINNDDNDPNRSLNQSVVEWTSDELVVLCPYCAKSFTFARRRHHCRLCGAILCNSCSRFLEYKSACKLVKPSKLYVDPYDRIEDRLQNLTIESQPSIRICEDCDRLLVKRIQCIEDYFCQPKLEEIYYKLKEVMSEADELMLSYSSLVNDQKQPIPELRAKIQTLKQSAALTGSKFKKMAEKESGKQAFLMRSISQTVVAWLKENLDQKVRRVHGSRAEKFTSWVPDRPSVSQDLSVDEDPLLIQIRNLEEYIKQAKEANRYEEVDALEANKRELEIEYQMQDNTDFCLDAALSDIPEDVPESM